MAEAVNSAATAAANPRTQPRQSSQNADTKAQAPGVGSRIDHPAAETGVAAAAAAEPAPHHAADSKTIELASASATSMPTWPTLKDGHHLYKFLDLLPSILDTTGHDEVYGITLKTASVDKGPNFYTLLILQKFLRANQNDIERASDQLTKTLEWRKEFDPMKAMTEAFAGEKFAGLGYITVVPRSGSQPVPSVTTWNIYGVVKDYEKTFTPVESFLRWRIALMELGVAKLELAKATVPIPDYGEGPDPYQGVQVHDYKDVSFIRMDPRAKAASKAAIQMLGDYYPEMLSRKLFVNVPLFMQWMFTFSKAIISAETAKKFAVLNDGKHVAAEIGESVPEEYGGKFGELSTVGESLESS